MMWRIKSPENLEADRPREVHFPRFIV